MRSALIFLLFLLFLSACALTPQVCSDQQCFDVELASTDVQRAKGLSARDSLATGQGMLFVFETTGTYRFWMKDTLIPLDMIWMDENGTIVHIERGVSPCEQDPCQVYDPGVEARYVLEVNAGEAAGLQIGHTLELPELS